MRCFSTKGHRVGPSRWRKSHRSLCCHRQRLEMCHLTTTPDRVQHGFMPIQVIGVYPLQRGTEFGTRSKG